LEYSDDVRRHVGFVSRQLKFEGGVAINEPASRDLTAHTGSQERKVGTGEDPTDRAAVGDLDWSHIAAELRQEPTAREE
jgi:hypothetical protein